MGTGLGHQKHFVAAALQTRPHPDFGFSPAIFPAVIEECDAAIDCLMNDLNRGLLVGSFAQMVATKTKGGNSHLRATEAS